MGFLYSQIFVKPHYPTQSFRDQTVIVTGSNVGLGKEAARHFARLGASKLILAVRNVEAGEEARKDIISTTKADPNSIEVWKMDLGDYSSVKSFAERAKKLERIDVLLENAGISAGSWKVLEGHESTVTVNVISTFLLAFLLLPKLKETASKFNIRPRLTIVSSEVHGWTKFKEATDPRGVFAALDDQKTTKFDERYPTSKLLEVLTIRAISEKVGQDNVILATLNPGLCHSSLSRDGPFVLELLKFFLARTTEVGSRTLVAAAAAGEESHGSYMTDGHPANDALSPFVQSAEGKNAQDRVWQELKGILEEIEPGVTKGY